ncbi:response regulator transcription factor [Chloroflexia bacterium SDU3-3]|nr:response regulator transcription factor [Chloroflexia bacterium SDU3-3]
MSAENPITIVIADDHEVVRLGLQLTIGGEEDMQLVGEAVNGEEAIEIVRKCLPRVVLLDIEMPKMDGIAALSAIRAEHPAMVVLMLTSYRDDARLYAALRAGASGYLLKEMGGGALLAAIRGAARGEPQLHADIARRLMDRVAPPSDPLGDLTLREREVLQYVARGMSNKEVSAALSLTEHTVKGYMRDILSKLGVEDRTQAALLAVRYGLIHPDDLLEAASAA